MKLITSVVSRGLKSMENKNLIVQVSESDFDDKVIEKSENTAQNHEK